MGKMYRFKLKFGKDVPDIVFDGILDDKVPRGKFNYSDNKRICIRNNKGASYANLDAAKGFKNISRDSAPMDCSPSSTASVQ
jgi:hypothetical protein